MLVRGRRRYKRVEVRSYKPRDYTPRGHTPMQVGSRMFLLCNGHIWGSARLQEVVTYRDRDAFTAAEQQKAKLEQDLEWLSREVRMPTETVDSWDASGRWEARGSGAGDKCIRRR